MAFRLKLLPFLLLCAAPAAAADPSFSLPIACTPGSDCFIQNYVDDEPGPGLRDYACGTATYDGHKGVDIRLQSTDLTARNVPVLAAAPGKIRAIRDGVEDKIYTPGQDAAIKDKECGNGVVIDHGGNWESQYCHMKRGSIVVQPGQTVTPGTMLGAVGYSGKAEFAHLHFEVRKAGRTVDPFTGDPLGTLCRRDATGRQPLFKAEILQQLPYQRGGIFEAGFMAAPPTLEGLEGTRAQLQPPAPSSPMLIYYGRLMNLEARDRIRITLNGPGDVKVEALSEPLPRPKAVYLHFAGKKLKAPRWPAGTYEGSVSIIRNNQVFRTFASRLTFPP